MPASTSFRHRCIGLATRALIIWTLESIKLYRVEHILPCSKLAFSFCRSHLGAEDRVVLRKTATPGILASDFLDAAYFT